MTQFSIVLLFRQLLLIQLLLFAANTSCQQIFSCKCEKDTFKIGECTLCNLIVDTQRVKDPAGLHIFQNGVALQRTGSRFVYQYCPFKGGTEHIDFDCKVSNTAGDSSFRVKKAFYTRNPLDALMPKDKLFSWQAEVPATFKNGTYDDFDKYLVDELTKLDLAFKKRMIAIYLIDKAGKATLIRIDGTLSKTNFDHIQRIVNTSTKWTPSKKKGKAVNSMCLFEINP